MMPPLSPCVDADFARVSVGIPMSKPSRAITKINELTYENGYDLYGELGPSLTQLKGKGDGMKLIKTGIFLLECVLDQIMGQQNQPPFPKGPMNLSLMMGVGNMGREVLRGGTTPDGKEQIAYNEEWYVSKEYIKSMIVIHLDDAIKRWGHGV